MIDFAHQSVLLIGGVHDITLATARAFEQRNANLVFVTDPALIDTAGETFPKAQCVGVNLNDPDALAASLSDQKFNVAIVSPGAFYVAPFMEQGAYDIDQAFAVNFTLTTYAIQAAAKHMIAHNQAGSITLLSSVAALMPTIETNLTGASMAGSHVIAQMAAIDLAPHNIRVNIVAFGWMQNDAWSAPFLNERGDTHTASDIPMGQAGDPQSVGDACCFLASPMASYITGTILPVDGGFLRTKSASSTPLPSP